jgi:hypothetical protein
VNAKPRHPNDWLDTLKKVVHVEAARVIACTA